MGQAFTRFMVDVGIGTNRKIRRLPVVERWVYVAGVLALAAQSPMRGALLIADGEPVTPEDIASEASVSVRHARSALESLARLGMLHTDADGVLWVHDWDKLNPDPKPSDSPEATRERKRKQRDKARSSESVTRDTGVTEDQCHAPEVEGEEEVTPLSPPQAGGTTCPKKPRGHRGTDWDDYWDDMTAWTGEHFPDCLPKSISMIASAIWAEGREPTADSIRQFAAAHPNFAVLLQPTEGVAA